MLVIVALYPAFKHSTGLDKLITDNPAIAAMFGVSGSLSSPAGWVDANAYTNFLPLIMLLLTIGYGAAAIAGQDEDGTLGLLVTLPLPRHQILAQKVAAMIAQALVLTITVTACVYVGRGFDVTLERLACRDRVARACSRSESISGSIALAIGAGDPQPRHRDRDHDRAGGRVLPDSARSRPSCTGSTHCASRRCSTGPPGTTNSPKAPTSRHSRCSPASVSPQRSRQMRHFAASTCGKTRPASRMLVVRAITSGTLAKRRRNHTHVPHFQPVRTPKGIKSRPPQGWRSLGTLSGGRRAPPRWLGRRRDEAVQHAQQRDGAVLVAHGFAEHVQRGHQCGAGGVRIGARFRLRQRPAQRRQRSPRPEAMRSTRCDRGRRRRCGCRCSRCRARRSRHCPRGSRRRPRARATMSLRARSECCRPPGSGRSRRCSSALVSPLVVSATSGWTVELDAVGGADRPGGRCAGARPTAAGRGPCRRRGCASRAPRRSAGRWSPA